MLGIVLAFEVGHAQGAIITTLFNTGVDASGAVLPDGTIGDPHYTLTSVPSGSTDIRVITSASNFPIPPYLGDNSLSRWIGPNNDPDLNSPPGNYVYETTFDLTGLNPSTASISGAWSSDNDGVDIKINGVSIGTVATSFTQFSSGFAPFTITSGFVSGLNTLEFVIHNGGSAPGDNSGNANPSALRVEMSGTAAVPEPTSLIVWTLLSSLAMGIGWRRKKSQG